MKFALYLTLFLAPFFCMAQRSISSDPFLKWTCASNVLTYSTIEYDIDYGTMQSNNIDATTSIKIKVHKPRGFKEIDNLIYFGLSLLILDAQTDTVVYEIKDLYADEKQGVDPSILSNLNVSITPDLKCANFTLKIRIFDKKGEGDIRLNSPFNLVKSTDASSNTNYFSKWNSEPNYCILGQGIDANNSQLKTVNGGLQSLEFNRKDQLYFQTDLSKFKSNSYLFSYSLHDLNGKIIVTQSGSYTSAWDGKTNFDLPTDLAQKPYLLTFVVENKIGRIGTSQLLHYKTKKELSAEEKIQFALLFNQLALQELADEAPRNAAQIMNNALAYAPTSIDVLLSSAKIFSNETIGKEDIALELLKTADSLYPNNIKILNELGLSYSSANQPNNAIITYKRCIALDKLNSNYYAQIAQCYRNDSKNVEALAYLDTCIQYNQDTTNSEIYLKRIEINTTLEKYSEVINDYKQLVKISPEYWEYYYKIGYNQIDLKDYPAAIFSLTKAMEMNEYRSDPIYERGYAYMKSGKFKDAIADFNQTVVVASGDEPKQLYLHRGNCHLALKDNKNACLDFKKAMVLGVNGAKEAVDKSCTLTK